MMTSTTTTQTLLLLTTLLLSLLAPSHQTIKNNKVETQQEDDSPFSAAADAIFKEQNLQNIGSALGGLLQSKQLGDVLQNVATQGNAGKLLQGLQSVLGSAGNDKDGSGGSNNLEMLGSILGAVSQLNGGNQDNGDSAGSLLQGLGSLLGGEGGGGIDPALLGSLAEAFAGKDDGASKVEDVKPTGKSRSKKLDKRSTKRSQQQSADGFDFGDLLSLAGSFMGKSNSGGAGNFLDYLPMIVNTISAFTGPEANQRARSHSGHSDQMPPVLERVHVFFDNFIHSDMGQHVISSLGADKAFKMFIDENGEFNYAKFAQMLENHSFRRHWIRLLATRIMDFVQHLSNPEVYQNYLMAAQMFTNSFLRSQGFPKSATFDTAKPVESISKLANYAAKKYFDTKIDSKPYVKPAVKYVVDLFELSRAKAQSMDGSYTKEMTEKLTDTLNLEIIEPIARVNRAYRYAKNVPSCSRYVLCLINQEHKENEENVPAPKRILYKGASLIAAWYLSSDIGTSFWTLYTDITENTNCKALYSENCNGFHEEEIRATTEYVHSEL